MIDDQDVIALVLFFAVVPLLIFIIFGDPLERRTRKERRNNNWRIKP